MVPAPLATMRPTRDCNPDSRMVRPLSLEHNPCRGVIARTGLAADGFIDAGRHEPFGELRTEQKMIEPKARISLETMPHVMPESVDAFFGVLLAQRVGPALLDQSRISGPAFRLDQCVIVPGFCRVDIDFGRRDIVIARQHDWRTGLQ